MSKQSELSIMKKQENKKEIKDLEIGTRKRCILCPERK